MSENTKIWGVHNCITAHIQVDSCIDVFKSYFDNCLPGLIVWGGTYDTDIIQLERIHLDAMRLITGETARSSITALFKIKTTSLQNILK